MDYQRPRPFRKGLSYGLRDREQWKPSLAPVNTALKDQHNCIEHILKELANQKREVTHLLKWSASTESNMADISERVAAISARLSEKTNESDSGSDNDTSPESPVSDSDEKHSSELEKDSSVLPEESSNSGKKKNVIKKVLIHKKKPTPQSRSV